MKIKLGLFLVIFSVIAFGSDPKFKFSEMVQKSDLIIHGKVLSTESKWVEDSRGKHIYSYAEIYVSEFLKGSMPGNRFTLEIVGGKVGEITEVVSSSYSIQQGEEVILYLNNNPLRPVGFSEAKMTLSKDNVFLQTKKVSSKKFLSYIRQIIEKPVDLDSYESVEKAIDRMDEKVEQGVLKNEELELLRKSSKYKNESKLLLAQPDLAPYKPAIFADKITIKKSTITDPNTQLAAEDSPIYDTDVLYFAFSVANLGAGASSGFNVRVLVDGTELTTVTRGSALNPGFLTYWYNVNVGSISQGNHTLRLIADCDLSNVESDETNNEYTRSITVLHAAGSPSITGISPASGSAGTNTQVAITGSGFGATQGSVEFFYRSGQPKIPAAITSWSDGSIVCDVPIGTVNGYAGSAASGPVTVNTSGGSTSNGYTFSVTFGYGGTKWSGAFATVPLKINENYPGMSDEGAQVQAAALTWSGAGANFAFQYTGTSGATDASSDGQNTICWGTTSGSLATAYYWFSGSNMIESDIVFNNTWTWTSNGTGYDVQGIALHELGHWLNLRDLYGGANASQVMYGFGGSGEVKRGLSSGEVSGIQYIYGTGGPPPAPTAPTLSSPADGVTGTALNPQLEWTASSGATSYGIQISTSSSFGSTVVSQTGITVTMYIPSGVLSNNTTYYWRVNATNGSGTSSWSSYRSFTTLNAIPPVPVLSSPSNGATNVSLSPTLQWSASSGATGYQLKVATDAGFTGIIFNQSVASTSQALSSLNYGTTYYWEVLATNSAGSSAYSTAWSFQTMPAAYPMTGQVTLNGAGMDGVTVSLSGTTTGTNTTDVTGNYSFTGTNGGNYTVTPSKINYSFSPSSQTYNPLNSSKTQNFTATLITYSISGAITNNGAPLAGVTVTLTGTTSATTTTAANGTYSFANLTSNGNYTVTPTKTNYTFSPVNQNYNPLNSNKTLNFTSTFITYSISGVVSLQGASFFGVTLNLTGSSTGTTTTIENGSYSFSGLLPGSNYTVTPVMANYIFTPVSQAYTSLAENKTLNFEAVPLAYTISGVITSGGQPLANVSVSLSGSSTRTTTTNASGAFSFTSLTPGGNFTITPSKSGYTFVPVNAVFNNISENKTQNFTGTAITYTISGNITSEGSSLGGIILTLSGSSSVTVTSLENGSYSFTNLLSGGNYTVTPVKPNYTFTPLNIVYNNLSENKIQNFEGAIDKYTISGVIKSGGVALSGVLVTLSGSKNGTITTGVDGSYTFSSLNAGGNYTVTPSKQNYAFTPLSGSFSNLLENKIQDFNGIFTGTFSISGIVSSGGTGLSGVTVNLSGSSTGSVTTAVDGSYSFSALAANGNYTITPVKSGYVFSPLNAVFNNLTENKLQNFSSAVNVYSISGVITSGGTGISNITVNLSGGANITVTTDASGAYTFTGLAAGGNYSVTPTKTNYKFTPSNAVIGNLSENKTQNFTAELLQYSIVGNIKSSGVALSGVTVSLSGDKTLTTATDKDGNYSFSALNSGGNYLVTPTKVSYTFSPLNAPFNNLAENKIQDFSANFTGTYSISGAVTKDGAGVAGVTLALTGSSSTNVLTGNDGTYTFAGLAAGGSYTITPSKDYYSFSPLNAVFSSLSENKTQNFAALLNTYSISGTIQSNISALQGVTLNLTGAKTESQITNANGYYIFSGLNAVGSYTITPVKANYKFDPVNKLFSSLIKNEIQNFTGTPLTEVSDYSDGMPKQFYLGQNYPNPFNPGTRIDFLIPENSYVSLKVYNSLGIEVESLIERNMSNGKYSTSWNPINIPSGVYYYQIKAGKYFEMKKMLYLR